MRLITSHFISVIFYIIPTTPVQHVEREASKYIPFLLDKNCFQSRRLHLWSSSSNFSREKVHVFSFQVLKSNIELFFIFLQSAIIAGQHNPPHCKYLLGNRNRWGTGDRNTFKVMHGISHLTFLPATNTLKIFEKCSTKMCERPQICWRNPFSKIKKRCLYCIEKKAFIVSKLFWIIC